MQDGSITAPGWHPKEKRDIQEKHYIAHNKKGENRRKRHPFYLLREAAPDADGQRTGSVVRAGSHHVGA